MARKTNVVVKWGVAQTTDKGVSLLTFGSRDQARTWCSTAKAAGGQVKRPFKIYVEV